MLNAYTEEIVGWSVGDNLGTECPLKALKMALERIERDANVDLIHHSDRG